MSKKNGLQHKAEFVISIILVILLLIILDPGMFWMPSMLIMSIGIIILLLFILFSAYLWKEQPKDEREQTHSLYAGRYAFFVGTAVLMLGTLFEYFMHHKVNVWTVLALAAMILTKSMGRIWAEKTK